MTLASLATSLFSGEHCRVCAAEERKSQYLAWLAVDTHWENHSAEHRKLWLLQNCL